MFSFLYAEYIRTHLDCLPNDSCPALFYGFYCDLMWQRLYMGGMVILGTSKEYLHFPIFTSDLNSHSYCLCCLCPVRSFLFDSIMARPTAAYNVCQSLSQSGHEATQSLPFHLPRLIGYRSSGAWIVERRSELCRTTIAIIYSPPNVTVGRKQQSLWPTVAPSRGGILHRRRPFVCRTVA